MERTNFSFANPNASRCVYEHLSTSDNPDILTALANAPFTPPDIVKYIFTDNPATDTNVRLAAIRSGKLPDELLYECIKCEDVVISEAAFRQIQLNKERNCLIMV